MAEYEPGGVGASAALSPQEPWIVWGEQSTDFAWVGLDSSKRTAPAPRVVLQSSAAFAVPWLDRPSLQPAGEALLQRAKTDLAAWLGHPQRWQVHRWRYATVQQSVQHLHTEPDFSGLQDSPKSPLKSRSASLSSK